MLPTRLSGKEKLRKEDSGAKEPLRIDPVMKNPEWPQRPCFAQSDL